MITLYGIKNCDTVKKARKWLEAESVEYRFHDFRSDGLDRETVQQWLSELGWQGLINKRSTSWKALGAEARDSMSDDEAVGAILDQPTLIKRPLLDTGKQRICGFSADEYRKLFSRHTL